MSDFGIGGFAEIIEHGFDVSTIMGTPVTASGTTDTKGSWATLVTAANNLYPMDYVEVDIAIDRAGGIKSVLVDIGIDNLEPRVKQIVNSFISLFCEDKGQLRRRHER